MRKFYTGVVRRRKSILIFFIASVILCAVLKNFVSVNYDMNDYLPEDAKSTVALDMMEQEFEGGIPNARVMINHVTIPEALEYKEKLKAVDGVTEVTWLDDAVDITLPISAIDKDILETYYADNTALLTVTIEKTSRISAVADIREIIGDENAMSGSAVSTATATLNTVSEIQKITVIAVLFVLIVLILTTSSWVEPIIILAGLGIAILINGGTNLIFGEISFVTNAAGSILQLAVSLDYSVFLIHRFEECRKETADVQEAMVDALCKSTTSILSSGLTTVIGFLALALMQFQIGPDLGLALAKGVAVSLIIVFLFMPSLVLSAYKFLDKTKHRPLMPSFRKFGAAELHEGVFDLQDGAQSDLKSGVNDLKDGAEQLHSGAADLKDGGSTLQDGAADLQNGVNVLDEGIHSLNSGIGQMQEALNTLNQQSPELVNGSVSFKAALTQLQEALGGVSLATEDLSALTDASSAMKAGIDDLVNGITALQSNVNFDAYKGAMSQNGLDIDGLRQKNESAISGLEGLISSLSTQIEGLENAGMDTSEIESQVSQLSDIISLLKANNASIGGTDSYLQTVSSNLSSLLQGATALQENYRIFDGKIGELVNKIGGLAYQMSELSSAINTLVSEYGKLDQGINGYTEAVAKIVASYSQITDGAAQLVTGSSALKTGSKSLYSGTGELLSGIVEIYDGVAELLSGITQLYDGAGELKDGTSTMREETAGMDTEITDKIDELIETVTGGDFEVTSFVSEKNTNVQSVQFVIKADGVQTEEVSEVMEEAPKKLTVWQKFLNLFGLYREN